MDGHAWVHKNTAPLSDELASRVAREPPGFLDELGYGTWTDTLDPAVPTDRKLIIELLERLYNRPDDGFYVNEMFGRRHGYKTKSMCDSYLQQLLTLARHRVAAFASKKDDGSGTFDICYDLPAVYNSVPGYFDIRARPFLSLTGTGGGRKRCKGAPGDFIEGQDYFKSRVRAVQTLRQWDQKQAREAPIFPRTKNPT